MNNFMIPVALITVVLIGMLMLFILATTRKKSGVLNIEEYQIDWLKIMNSLETDKIETFEFAVINADKLLDKALKELGVPGVTMAERIKSAKAKFSKPKDIWAAHALRNKIAHESDFKLRIATARRALAIFKKALKEIGAI